VTSAAASAAGARATDRVRASADTIALTGLGGLLLALLAASWGTWGDLDSDTGYDVVAGALVADGAVPYADFLYYYGPLSAGLSGFAALVGGTGLGPATVLGLAVTLLVIAATYCFARVVVGPFGAFVAAAITSAVAFIPNNYSFVLPHTYAAPLGTLLVLAVLLGLVRFAATERRSALVLAGAATGLLLLTKPEPALAGLAAVAAWLLVRPREGGGRRRVLFPYAAPALMIPVLVYGALLTQVSPGKLLWENLYPRDQLDAGMDTMLRARMPLTLESGVDLAKYFVLYALGAAFVVGLGWAIGRGGRLRGAALATAAVGGLGFVALSVVKPDGLRDAFYYIWGWIPLAAAVVAVLAIVRARRPGGWTVRGQAELLGSVTLAVLAITTYSGFVTHGWRPSMAVYYVPLAAILLVRLHLVELARSRAGLALGAAWVAFVAAACVGLTLKDARADSVTVHGSNASLAEAPAEARLYQGAVDEIEAATKPGDRIFVTPMMTGLYVLTGRSSPLREISMLPGALPTLEDERAAVARLDAANVGLVVTDRREWKGYGHGAFGETFQRHVAAWLHDNFDLKRTLRASGGDPRTLDIWIRRVS
jgi:Dolichyl-phosphate-mannose-protein mannosyltransferase